MRSVDLLVAPWGLPWDWRPATYVYENCRLESSSSLACLARALNPKRILIVVSESALCSDRMIEEFAAEIRKGDYGEALEGLKAAIEEYVGDTGVAASEAVRVVVCPAHGSFKPRSRSTRCRWSSLGNPVSNYASCVMAGILGELAGMEGHGKVRIAVDITHGINYMPLAAFRAAMAAARIVSASKGVRATVEVFNSDPYVPGLPDQALGIHLVDHEAVTSVKAATRLVYTVAAVENPTPVSIADAATLERLGLSASKAGSIARGLGVPEARRVWQQLYAKARRVSAALHYGLPLALLQYGYENAQPPGGSWLAHAVHTLLGVLAKSLVSPVVAGTGDGWIRVLRLVGFNYDDVKAVLASAAFLDYARRTYLEYSGEVRASGYGALEVPLDVLRGVAEGYLPPAQQELVKNELASPTSPLKYAGLDWTRLGEKGKHAETNVRNYIAHAGLERNIIEARREARRGGEVILVRFCEEALTPRGKKKPRRLDELHDTLAGRLTALTRG